MPHIRTTIREGIAAALAAAGTAAGSRVFSERVQAVDAAEYPFIELSLVREQQQRTAYGGGRANALIERTLDINVHYTQKAASGYYNAADEALRLIDAALASATIAGLKDIEPSGTLFDLEIDGDKPLYTVTQTYTVTYITPQGNPATAY
jgi:hypothetical protein